MTPNISKSGKGTPEPDYDRPYCDADDREVPIDEEEWR